MENFHWYSGKPQFGHGELSLIRWQTSIWPWRASLIQWQTSVWPFRSSIHWYSGKRQFGHWEFSLVWHQTSVWPRRLIFHWYRSKPHLIRLWRVFAGTVAKFELLFCLSLFLLCCGTLSCSSLFLLCCALTCSGPIVMCFLCAETEPESEAECSVRLGVSRPACLPKVTPRRVHHPWPRRSPCVVRKGGFSRDWKETKVFQLWWRGVVCCAHTRRTVLASVGRNVTASKVTGKFQLMWWVFFLACNFIDTGHPFEI